MKKTLVQLPNGDWILPSSILAMRVQEIDRERGETFVVIDFPTVKPGLPAHELIPSLIRIPVGSIENGWKVMGEIARDLGLREPEEPKTPRWKERFHDFQDANRFSLVIKERTSYVRESAARFYCQFEGNAYLVESENMKSGEHGNGATPEAAIESYARVIAGRKLCPPGRDFADPSYINVPNFFD